MKKGIIQDRLDRANKVDYTNARDVQNFIQEKVNHESLLEWARKEQPRQPMSIAGLPSRLYERETRRSWLGEFLSGLIP